jgi:hypothetical protein
VSGVLKGARLTVDVGSAIVLPAEGGLFALNAVDGEGGAAADDVAVGVIGVEKEFGLGSGWRVGHGWFLSLGRSALRVRRSENVVLSGA